MIQVFEKIDLHHAAFLLLCAETFKVNFLGNILLSLLLMINEHSSSKITSTDALFLRVCIIVICDLGGLRS